MKRLPILLLALLFTVGCSTAPKDIDVDAIRQEGYDEGYAKGFGEGKAAGYANGKSDAMSSALTPATAETSEKPQALTPTPEPTIEPPEMYKEAYIDAKSLNLRAEPSRNAEILAEIDGGTAVGITGESGEWYAITVNGQNGYMLKEYVAAGQKPSEDNASKETDKPTQPPKTEKPAAPVKTEAPSAPSGAVTTGQKNALRKAKSYLNVMAFSYSGLIEQLEYSGFSNSEATYGADNCGADWNQQAAKKAKSYLDVMSFSRSGLIEQLEYSGFTHSQAEYGASQNGY